jgi:hypothetical protein
MNGKDWKKFFGEEVVTPREASEYLSVVMGHDLSPLHSHDILRCVRHIPL